MIRLEPYLTFQGKAEEALNFYKSVFGGAFSSVMRFKETPEGDKVSAAEKDKIMHIALPVGKGVTLMASDMLDSRGKISAGDNFSLSITVESRQEADRIFNGLSKGGKADMPMQKTFWGDYFGMLSDKFGIRWMVSFPESRPR